MAPIREKPRAFVNEGVIPLDSNVEVNDVKGTTAKPPVGEAPPALPLDGMDDPAQQATTAPIKPSITLPLPKAIDVAHLEKDVVIARAGLDEGPQVFQKAMQRYQTKENREAILYVLLQDAGPEALTKAEKIMQGISDPALKQQFDIAIRVRREQLPDGALYNVESQEAVQAYRKFVGPTCDAWLRQLEISPQDLRTWLTAPADAPPPASIKKVLDDVKAGNATYSNINFLIYATPLFGELHKNADNKDLIDLTAKARSLVVKVNKQEAGALESEALGHDKKAGELEALAKKETDPEKKKKYTTDAQTQRGMAKTQRDAAIITTANLSRMYEAQIGKTTGAAQQHAREQHTDMSDGVARMVFVEGQKQAELAIELKYTDEDPVRLTDTPPTGKPGDPNWDPGGVGYWIKNTEAFDPAAKTSGSHVSLKTQYTGYKRYVGEKFLETLDYPPTKLPAEVNRRVIELRTQKIQLLSEEKRTAEGRVSLLMGQEKRTPAQDDELLRLSSSLQQLTTELKNEKATIVAAINEAENGAKQLEAAQQQVHALGREIDGYDYRADDGTIQRAPGLKAQIKAAEDDLKAAGDRPKGPLQEKVAHLKAQLAGVEQQKLAADKNLTKVDEALTKRGQPDLGYVLRDTELPVLQALNAEFDAKDVDPDKGPSLDAIYAPAVKATEYVETHLLPTTDGLVGVADKDKVKFGAAAASAGTFWAGKSEAERGDNNKPTQASIDDGKRAQKWATYSFDALHFLGPESQERQELAPIVANGSRLMAVSLAGVDPKDALLLLRYADESTGLIDLENISPTRADGSKKSAEDLAEEKKAKKEVKDNLIRANALDGAMKVTLGALQTTHQDRDVTMAAIRRTRELIGKIQPADDKSKAALSQLGAMEHFVTGVLGLISLRKSKASEGANVAKNDITIAQHEMDETLAQTQSFVVDMPALSTIVLAAGVVLDDDIDQAQLESGALDMEGLREAIKKKSLKSALSPVEKQLQKDLDALAMMESVFTKANAQGRQFEVYKLVATGNLNGLQAVADELGADNGVGGAFNADQVNALISDDQTVFKDYFRHGASYYRDVEAQGFTIVDATDEVEALKMQEGVAVTGAQAFTVNTAQQGARKYQKDMVPVIMGVAAGEMVLSCVVPGAALRTMASVGRYVKTAAVVIRVVGALNKGQKAYKTYRVVRAATATLGFIAKAGARYQSFAKSGKIAGLVCKVGEAYMWFGVQTGVTKVAEAAGIPKNTFGGKLFYFSVGALGTSAQNKIAKMTEAGKELVLPTAQFLATQFVIPQLPKEDQAKWNTVMEYGFPAVGAMIGSIQEHRGFQRQHATEAMGAFNATLGEHGHAPLNEKQVGQGADLLYKTSTAKDETSFNKAREALREWATQNKVPDRALAGLDQQAAVAYAGTKHLGADVNFANKPPTGESLVKLYDQTVASMMKADPTMPIETARLYAQQLVAGKVQAGMPIVAEGQTPSAGDAKKIAALGGALDAVNLSMAHDTALTGTLSAAKKQGLDLTSDQQSFVREQLVPEMMKGLGNETATPESNQTLRAALSERLVKEQGLSQADADTIVTSLAKTSAQQTAVTATATRMDGQIPETLVRVAEEANLKKLGFSDAHETAVANYADAAAASMLVDANTHTAAGTPITNEQATVAQGAVAKALVDFDGGKPLGDVGADLLATLTPTLGEANAKLVVKSTLASLAAEGARAKATGATSGLPSQIHVEGSNARKSQTSALESLLTDAGVFSKTEIVDAKRAAIDEMALEDANAAIAAEGKVPDPKTLMARIETAALELKKEFPDAEPKQIRARIAVKEAADFILQHPEKFSNDAAAADGALESLAVKEFGCDPASVKRAIAERNRSTAEAAQPENALPQSLPPSAVPVGTPVDLDARIQHALSEARGLETEHRSPLIEASREQLAITALRDLKATNPKAYDGFCQRLEGASPEHRAALLGMAAATYEANRSGAPAERQFHTDLSEVPKTIAHPVAIALVGGKHTAVFEQLPGKQGESKIRIRDENGRPKWETVKSDAVRALSGEAIPVAWGKEGARANGYAFGTHDGTSVIYNTKSLRYEVVSAASLHPTKFGLTAVDVPKTVSERYEQARRTASPEDLKQLDSLLDSAVCPTATHQLIMLRVYGQRGSLADCQQFKELLSIAFPPKGDCSANELLRISTADGVVQYFQHSCTMTVGQYQRAQASPLEALKLIALGREGLVAEQSALLRDVESTQQPRQAAPVLQVPGKGSSRTLQAPPSNATSSSVESSTGASPDDAVNVANRSLASLVGAPGYKAVDGTPVKLLKGIHAVMENGGPPEGVQVFVDGRGGRHALLLVEVRSTRDSSGKLNMETSELVFRDPMGGIVIASGADLQKKGSAVGQLQGLMVRSDALPESVTSPVTGVRNIGNSADKHDTLPPVSSGMREVVADRSTKAPREPDYAWTSKDMSATARVAKDGTLKLVFKGAMSTADRMAFVDRAIGTLGCKSIDLDAVKAQIEEAPYYEGLESLFEVKLVTEKKTLAVGSDAIRSQVADIVRRQQAEAIRATAENPAENKFNGKCATEPSSLQNRLAEQGIYIPVHNNAHADHRFNTDGGNPPRLVIDPTFGQFFNGPTLTLKDGTSQFEPFVGTYNEMSARFTEIIAAKQPCVLKHLSYLVGPKDPKFPNRMFDAMPTDSAGIKKFVELYIKENWGLLPPDAKTPNDLRFEATYVKPYSKVNVDAPDGYIYPVATQTDAPAPAPLQSPKAMPPETASGVAEAPATIRLGDQAIRPQTKPHAFKLNEDVRWNEYKAKYPQADPAKLREMFEVSGNATQDPVFTSERFPRIRTRQDMASDYQRALGNGEVRAYVGVMEIGPFGGVNKALGTSGANDVMRQVYDGVLGAYQNRIEAGGGAVSFYRDTAGRIVPLVSFPSNMSKADCAKILTDADAAAQRVGDLVMQQGEVDGVKLSEITDPENKNYKGGARFAVGTQPADAGKPVFAVIDAVRSSYADKLPPRLPQTKGALLDKASDLQPIEFDANAHPNADAGALAGAPTILDRAVRRHHVERLATEAGVDVKQALADFDLVNTLDSVTGLHPASGLEPTIKNAVRYASEKGGTVIYGESDVGALASVTTMFSDAIGKEAGRDLADRVVIRPVLDRYTKKISDKVKDLNGEVHFFRKGGDEIGEVIILPSTLTPTERANAIRDINLARVEARMDVARYVEATVVQLGGQNIALRNIEHLKHLGNADKAGPSITAQGAVLELPSLSIDNPSYAASVDFAVADAMKRADHGVEQKKNSASLLKAREEVARSGGVPAGSIAEVGRQLLEKDLAGNQWKGLPKEEIAKRRTELRDTKIEIITKANGGDVTKARAAVDRRPEKNKAQKAIAPATPQYQPPAQLTRLLDGMQSTERAGVLGLCQRNPDLVGAIVMGGPNVARALYLSHGDGDPMTMALWYSADPVFFEKITRDGGAGELQAKSDRMVSQGLDPIAIKTSVGEKGFETINTVLQTPSGQRWVASLPTATRHNEVLEAFKAHPLDLQAHADAQSPYKYDKDGTLISAQDAVPSSSKPGPTIDVVTLPPFPGAKPLPASNHQPRPISTQKPSDAPPVTRDAITVDALTRKNGAPDSVDADATTPRMGEGDLPATRPTLLPELKAITVQNFEANATYRALPNDVKTSIRSLITKHSDADTKLWLARLATRPGFAALQPESRVKLIRLLGLSAQLTPSARTRLSDLLADTMNKVTPHVQTERLSELLEPSSFTRVAMTEDMIAAKHETAASELSSVFGIRQAYGLEMTAYRDAMRRDGMNSTKTNARDDFTASLALFEQFKGTPQFAEVKALYPFRFAMFEAMRGPAAPIRAFDAGPPLRVAETVEDYVVLNQASKALASESEAWLYLGEFRQLQASLQHAKTTGDKPLEQGTLKRLQEMAAIRVVKTPNEARLLSQKYLEKYYLAENAAPASTKPPRLIVSDDGPVTVAAKSKAEQSAGPQVTPEIGARVMMSDGRGGMISAIYNTDQGVMARVESEQLDPSLPSLIEVIRLEAVRPAPIRSGEEHVVSVAGASFIVHPGAAVALQDGKFGQVIGFDASPSGTMARVKGEDGQTVRVAIDTLKPPPAPTFGGLPSTETWRVLMDGNRQGSGPLGFDALEPGYLRSMYGAADWMLQNVNKKFGADDYAELHDRAMPTSETLGFRQEVVMKKAQYLAYGVEGATNQAKLEINADLGENGKWGVCLQDTVILTEMPTTVIRDATQKTLDDYYAKIAKLAPNDADGKIRAIVECCQILDRRHPFRDGNTRSAAMLLMNKLLMAEGLSPVIWHDPNDIESLTRAQCFDEVKQGQRRFQEEVSKHAPVETAASTKTPRSEALDIIYQLPDDLQGRYAQRLNAPNVDVLALLKELRTLKY
jgi:hypothetical protein